MTVSLPSPPNILADGNAPFVSSSEMVSLPSWPNAWIRPVLVTVAVPPWMGTAPALMRMLPVASRLVVIVLSRLSPVVVSAPLPGLKVLETAIVTILSKLALGTDAPQP